MTEPLAPKPATGEDKPRYEPPQIVDLSRMAQGHGGQTVCEAGSGNANFCAAGPFAGPGNCAPGQAGERTCAVGPTVNAPPQG